MCVLTISAAFALTLAAAPASAAQPLTLGFSDGAFAGPDGGSWLARAARAGASIVRIEAGWVAPDTRRRPVGFAARDPASPLYDFSRTDEAMRHAARFGLRVLLVVTGAPRWAEGRGRPSDAPPGSWRPDPAALGDYARALATRYSGRYADPAEAGATLPRAAALQVWNEPNLPKYLSPQWSGDRPASPALYRAMVNAFWRGAKAADPSSVVVTAGTGPFGDPGIGGRIMPALFWREVLCLDPGQRPGAGACREALHADVLSHHPYSVGVPSAHALNDDDISIPDMGRLTSLVSRAEHVGSLMPRRHHPVWVTEVSYDSGPPDPQGVPLTRHARFLATTLWLLWRQGIAAVFWQQVGDQPPVPSYAATAQSGVYFIDGRPKPALAAFRFPLVATARGRGLSLWGRAPAPGGVRIQVKRGNRWVTSRSLHVDNTLTFTAHLLHTGSENVRAVQGEATSLPAQTQ